MNHTTPILIVGLGLLGGSYARGLRKAGFIQVEAIDTDPQAVEFALEQGYITAGTTHQVEVFAGRAQRVIFALYPTALEQWVSQYGGCLPQGCICTDVSGVKTGLVDRVQELLGQRVEFIASHPMAGREVRGVQNAHLVEFSPANFLITPTNRNTQQGIDFARQLAQVLGFAHIRQLSCQEHDKMIGYVSQLTHAIAVSLMCAPGAEEFASYTGDSFRDLTRIAAINETMWAELFLWNRENLMEEMQAFCARMDQMRQYLEQQDRPALEAMFRQSTQARRAFDQKEKER